MSELEVNGHWPKVENNQLQELIIQEFWYDGVLEEPVNVAYLKVSNLWYKLYFDCGIVFWRQGHEGLEDELASRNKDTEYPIKDLAEELGIKGSEITSCSGKVILEGSEVELKIKGHKALVFQCINDVTTVKT
ncbi:hypothetical protein [Shewanella decolorationis]|uniref:hypothetical protein n=1 Tax=Shewanella decolorationis TaxID=256839 RepID=UPI001056F153|nr:hypothetical protein [Shewanella decolorationis]